jgi:23S rRNA maturation mini-RNase III
VRQTDGSEIDSDLLFTHINHPPPSEGGTAPARKKPGREPKTPLPLDEKWWPDAKLVAWVREHCAHLDDESMKIHTLRFRNYNHGNAKRQKDWPLTYKNWMLKEEAELAERAKKTSAKNSPSSVPYKNKPAAEAHSGWKARQKAQAAG